MIVFRPALLRLCARINMRTLRTATLVALPLVLGAIAILGVALILSSDRANREIVKNTTMQRDAEHIAVLVQAAESGERAFLLTDLPRYLRPYNNARTRLPAALDALAHSSQAA